MCDFDKVQTQNPPFDVSSDGCNKVHAMFNIRMPFDAVFDQYSVHFHRKTRTFGFTNCRILRARFIRVDKVIACDSNRIGPLNYFLENAGLNKQIINKYAILDGRGR